MLAASAAAAFAQSGDRPGEVQNPPPADMVIPPAPALSPEEALKTFQIAPGFRIELVASEPMIEAPVAMDWDPDGRLYVLEMRGFMPNVDGIGEDKPVGRVTRLEDTDNDGRMDKHTVFADGLVMARALVVLRDGVIVAEPPYLWLFKDTDGDGKADEKEQLSNEYGNQKNPEHNANGLLWGRDNWLYNANHPLRYRYNGEELIKDVAGPSSPGQWGISQDDYGRLYFNSNSDHIRADLVPRHYLVRNPNFQNPYGDYIRLQRNQEVWPIRVTPGVNRGYQRGTLRPNGRLRNFTGACGPGVYRGSLFPEKYYGAAFICEPTANLVRCSLITEKEGMLSAENAFHEKEFLASTDERFRPVNIYNGPDGALYIVDMYRGVLQHRIYLTTYLRKQAVKRGLETPLNLGRIYRVIPENARRAPVPRLTTLSPAELVRQLESPEGAVRDETQQFLVEHAPAEAVEPLNALASKGAFPSAIHALWALHGMDRLTGEPILAALRSSEPKVRATAIRVGEGFLNEKVQEAILELTDDPAADVQIQLAFSLGESDSREAEAAMLRVLNHHPDNRIIRDAIITGLHQRELDFAQRVMAQDSWSEKSDGRNDFLRTLARCVAESRDPARINDLLSLAAAQDQAWHRFALLDGLAGLIPPRGRNNEQPNIRPVRFESKPEALDNLAASENPGLKERLEKLDPLLVWPDKEGFQEREVAALNEIQQKRFEMGRELYTVVCGACHQPTGQGLEGLAPPLVNSEWTTGSPERLARIILHGLRGPLNVKGKNWELEMPPLFVLNDEQVASIMTFVRREWGHTASPVSPEFVEKVRKETADRQDAWTEAELLKIP